MIIIKSNKLKNWTIFILKLEYEIYVNKLYMFDNHQ